MVAKKSSKTSTVCIQRSTYPNLNLTTLLAPLGGMQKYISKGNRVLLKVNLLAASTPAQAVVTHPTLVRAVAQAVQKVGGVPIIGDSPGGPFSKRRLDKVYERAGLTELSHDLGIDLNYDTSSKKLQIPGAKKLKKTKVCNYILDADKIIALPKLKTHSLMMMTLATKIMYGAVPGVTKARYHMTYRRSGPFADMLLDLLTIVQPDLFIMDGVVGMQGDGPFSGSPVNLGVILAAENAIAMDLAVCKILGIEPVGIPTLKRAKVRGLWPNEIQYPLSTPRNVYYQGFRLPSSANYILTGKKQPKRSPVPQDNCIGCGDCQEICPKAAIKIINERAKIDYSLCIQCYCCHEICPENAINLEVLK